MRKYVFVGIGSFVGAVLRYLVKGIVIPGYHENVPINTLIINVCGAFILAFILTVAFEVWEFSPDIRTGLTVGLLGAFTTFSTLCKETVGLMSGGDYFSAISYVTVSVMLGLGFAYLGIVLAREFGSRIVKKKENSHDPSSNNTD